MILKDKMTKNVVTIKPNEPIGKVAQLMKEHNIGSIPVCEGNNVVEIIIE